MAGRPAGDPGQWTRLTDGLVTVAIGFAIFAVGVAEGFSPIEIAGGLVIAAGLVTVLITLLRHDRQRR